MVMRAKGVEGAEAVTRQMLGHVSSRAHPETLLVLCTCVH